MDFIHMQIKSDAAKLPLPLDILVPREGDRRRFKTVYLLHDFGANNTQWMRSTRVEQLMEGLDTVLIMPSCLNSFYVDMYYGSDFLPICRRNWSIPVNIGWDWILARSEELPLASEWVDMERCMRR